MTKIKIPIEEKFVAVTQF